MDKDIFYAGCRCPVCEIGTLNLVQKDLDFDYKGQTITLTRDVWECLACQESFLQPQDEPEVERILPDRRRRVDGLLVSGEILRIREQLRLSRRELAQTLRISEQVLAAYETGEDAQSYALDDLLRLLRVYPDAVNVLREEWQKIGVSSPKPGFTTVFTEKFSPDLIGA